MPQEPFEAYLESMKSDPLFRAELMAKESIAERMELICAEVLCYALNDMQQDQWTSVENEMEKSDQGNFLCDTATAAMLKGSSPQAAGYAKPSKPIGKRFED